MASLHLYLISQLFSVFGAAFALWKGGPAERLAAGVIILNVAIGTFSSRFLPESEGFIRLCNDGVAAAALLVITIRYAAPWMGGAMLAYAAQFAMHSYYLVTERPNDYWHALINNINWNITIWCLIIGTAMAWRQRSRVASRATLQPAP